MKQKKPVRRTKVRLPLPKKVERKIPNKKKGFVQDQTWENYEDGRRFCVPRQNWLDKKVPERRIELGDPASSNKAGTVLSAKS